MSSVESAWSDAAPAAAHEEITGAARRGSAAGGGVLLAAAAVLSVAALFPSGGRGIVRLDTSAGVVAYQAILAAGWLIAAGLVLAMRRRGGSVGALLAAGITVTQLGAVIAGIADVLAVATPGAGSWLPVAAFGCAVVGTALALRTLPKGTLGRPSAPTDPLLVVLTVVAAVVLAYALFPAWDHYLIESTSTGRSGVITATNLFAPGTVLGYNLGTLLEGLVIAAVPIVGVLWRPGRLGAIATGGVLLVVGATLVQAMVGYDQPYDLGPSAAGLVEHPSLTAWFDVEAVAAVALLLLVVARWWTPIGGSLTASYPSVHGAGMHHTPVRPATATVPAPPWTTPTPNQPAPYPPASYHPAPYPPPSYPPPTPYPPPPAFPPPAPYPPTIDGGEPPPRSPQPSEADSEEWSPPPPTPWDRN